MAARWSMRRWIARPLEAAVGVAERVAERDFTQRIAVSGQDEIARLMTSLATMQAQLATTIRHANERRCVKQEYLLIEKRVWHFFMPVNQHFGKSGNNSAFACAIRSNKRDILPPA